jgi:hypothetical protein
MPPVLTPPLQQYFDGPIHGLPADFDLRQIYLPFGKGEWNTRTRAALDADTRDHPRFWLIYNRANDYNGEFLQGVTADYRELEHHSYQFAELYLFEK